MKFDIDKLGLNRKLNKLKNNPELFVKDMVFKRTAQVKKYIPVKYEGKNNFTIVSAVYNVSSYLDEYFESIVKQSLNFKKHIFIVCVDDGSTDHSAEIIQKWQRKYPNNIQYIYKENGGQASARNLGLNYVDTEWVTFTDPDDYLHPDYFKKASETIDKNKDVSMLPGNIYFYFEKDNLTKDTHPLRYRFHRKTAAVDFKSMKDNIHLHASSTIFKMQLLKSNKISFDENVKPNFEDGKLIADFLLKNPNGKAIFDKDMIYFYRKREDGSSTLDSSWKNPKRYKDVFEYGFIPMLKTYKKELGYVPRNIQNTVLYDVSWYIHYLLNQDYKLDFLTSEEKQNFIELLKTAFQYIDAEAIWEFNLARIWYFQKVGMLGFFKDAVPPKRIAYIESIDEAKKQVLVNYFTYADSTASFKLNKIDTLPVFEKKVINKFAEEDFITEIRAWLPYESDEDSLSIYLDKKNIMLSMKGGKFDHGVKIKQIKECLNPKKTYVSEDFWILMDRDISADDNAEHLYRFIKKNHPEQKIYFALRRESLDWGRLAEQGFELLDFGSIEFEDKLKKCSKIISSHLEKYVHDYFGDNYNFSKKFTFLQHGITKDDLSIWFNTKKNIANIITCTQPEYLSLKDSDRYKFTDKEVKLTGFPRHDALLENNNFGTKKILVMPTWRSNLVGDTVGYSSERVKNLEFINSEYFVKWSGFLKSAELKELLVKFGYTLTFAPHPILNDYLSDFDLPEYIDIYDINDKSESIQHLFQNSDLLITDYSSIAFEFGVLRKLVLYYQFDRESFFSGEHTYQKGYYNYDTDGFGSVAFEEQDLISNLSSALENDAKPSKLYQEIMDQTFIFNDTSNSERVYSVLKNQDVIDTISIDREKMRNAIEKAVIADDFALTDERANQLRAVGNIEDIEYAENILLNLYMQQYKINDLKELVSDKTTFLASVVNEDWLNVLNFINSEECKDNIFKYYFTVFAASKLNEHELVKKLYKISKKLKSSVLDQYLEILLAYDAEDYEHILEVTELEQLVEFESIEDQFFYKLMKSYTSLMSLSACRYTDNLDIADNLLSSVETQFRTNISYTLEKFNVEYLKQDYKKVVSLMYSLTTQYNHLLSNDEKNKYAHALFEEKRFGLILDTIPAWISSEISSEILYYYIVALAEFKEWEKIIELSNEFSLTEEAKYYIVLAYYRLGYIDKAYSLIALPTYQDAYECWKLTAEIARIQEDVVLLKQCYKGMIAIFPDFDNQKNWNALNLLNTSI